ncbi:cyclic AMP-dependent transcription factor ATF-3-like [Rhopilema esculentum]|uniref:cyclic AMP-dependent transcription factor ATF-3-like n=1 Tax=Rhopilema esculentum TaxID=499914 RepID=UPI0031CEAFC6|eukprot:gene14791-5898_t
MDHAEQGEFWMSMPVVLPSSPQPSPASPVEPLDLRDIGDLPVKLELRYAIESRRNEKGLDIPPTMVQPKKLRLQLTPEEEERRRVRRQRNKLAASKCRVKRKNHVRCLMKQSDDLTRANNKLEVEIAKLRHEKDKLMDALKAHLCARGEHHQENRKRNSA